jgi:hypothetical protein
MSDTDEATLLGDALAVALALPLTSPSLIIDSM